MIKVKSSVILFLAIFVIAACSSTGTQTSKQTPAKASPAKSVSKAATPKPAVSPEKKADAPKSNLNPDSIDLEKPFEPTELASAVAKDEKAWKGKEVTLIGESNGHSVSKLKSGDVTSYTIFNDKGRDVAYCKGPKPPPAEAKGRGKGRVFKGTVDYALSGILYLEPCEFVK